MTKFVKKMRLLGLPVLLLALVLIFAGCDSNGDSETWHYVTSMNQLNGTWRGSFSQSMTIREYYQLRGWEWDTLIQNYHGNMTVTNTMDDNVTINTSTMRKAATARITTTYSGGNISVIWPDIRNSYPNDNSVTVNDSNYSVAYFSSYDVPVSIGSFLGYEINQNENRIRYRASTEVALFTSNDYIVLTRQ